MGRVAISHIKYIALIIAIVALDQVSKLVVLDILAQNGFEQIILTSFLKLVYVWNRGVSFGMFAGSEYSNILFLGIATVITIMLVRYLLKSQNSSAEISYSLIIGGAIGNIIDRLHHKAVFDFIYFHIDQFYWPAFNVADAAVTLGALIMVYNLFFQKSKV